MYHRHSRIVSTSFLCILQCDKCCTVLRIGCIVILRWGCGNPWFRISGGVSVGCYSSVQVAQQVVGFFQFAACHCRVINIISDLWRWWFHYISIRDQVTKYFLSFQDLPSVNTSNFFHIIYLIFQGSTIVSRACHYLMYSCFV